MSRVPERLRALSVAYQAMSTRAPFKGNAKYPNDNRTKRLAEYAQIASDLREAAEAVELRDRAAALLKRSL